MQRLLKNKQAKEQRYVVVNEQCEAYVGMRGGRFQWSSDWDEAIPLPKNKTYYLKLENPKVELIRVEEIKLAYS